MIDAVARALAEYAAKDPSIGIDPDLLTAMLDWMLRWNGESVLLLNDALMSGAFVRDLRIGFTADIV